jgi:phage terminase large subunit GpA-like protein
MNLADGFSVLAEAAIRGARPDPQLEIDKWSEDHMVVPKESAKPGRYRIAHTPLARRPLQVLSPRHPARRVVIRGASQMLKTQVALNFLAASAHQAPANMLVLEPTDSLAKRLSARVTKMIRDVPALQQVFAKPRSRDSRNTVFAKEFEGGTMYIATAGSAANLAEIPARYVYVDEIDRLDRDVDGEGDPVLLAEARTTTFEGTSKILHTSSPGLAGVSKIDQLFEMGTQEVYLVPCPHCGHHHELTVENFHYERDPDSGFMHRAWFACPECGADIDERYKARMLLDKDLGGTAHWHANSDGDGETISLQVSAFYAPVGSITWLKLAREHARAKELLEQGSPEAMQVFYNTRLALSWANTLEQTTWQELMARADIKPRVVPDWALVVTSFADTQHNRLEVQTHAWGPGLEHAVIDYQVLMGSPSVSPETPGSCWHQLDAYRRTPWAHASGIVLYTSIYGADTGGLNTQDVYNYASARVHQGCIAAHGSSRPNRPIISSVPAKADIDWNGKRVEGGVLLWTIGTDVAKDHLFNRFKLTSGWGAMHFNSALHKEWFEGLVAERPILKRKPGGGFRRVYEKYSPSDRNEPLDLTVYNLALAHHLGLHKWSSLDWHRLRERLIPKQLTPDLFASQAVAAPAAASPPPAAPSSPGETTEPDPQQAQATAAEPGTPPEAQPPAVAPIPIFPPSLPATSGRRQLSRGLA